MASVTGSKTLFNSFEPTETPKWREQSLKEHEEIPKISQMVEEISRFISRYQALKSSPDKEEALNDLLVSYLLNIQQHENIGVNDASQTKEIITEMTEEKLQQIYESRSQNKKKMPEKDIRETQTLFRAYKHLEKELNQHREDCDNERDFKPSIGLLEVDSIIVETHKVLMKELIAGDKTGPGVFSTVKRSSLFRGLEVHYPIFNTKAIARAAVSTIVDLHNGMVPEVNQRVCDDFNPDVLLKLFKRASMFLYSFLQLHPFGDGNGRLARLLTSYSLLTFSPFMTPIYNVFSPSQEKHYIQALVDTRISVDLDLSEVINDESNVIDSEDKSKKVANYLMGQKPKDLCAMLIESNWSMWRQFLYKLGDGSIHFSKWELELQQQYL